MNVYTTIRTISRRPVAQRSAKRCRLAVLSALLTLCFSPAGVLLAPSGEPEWGIAARCCALRDDDATALAAIASATSGNDAFRSLNAKPIRLGVVIVHGTDRLSVSGERCVTKLGVPRVPSCSRER